MRITLEVTLTPEGEQDIERVIDALHEHLCGTGDDETWGIESFDGADPERWVP